MEVGLPYADLLQAGLRVIQISETVWFVPCTVNPAENEYTPMLKPYNIESKQKSRHTWSAEEDRSLVGIVEDRGPKNWNVIAKELNAQLYGTMPVRQGKQCRERWFNHLNPTLRKGNWKVSEDIYILESQINIGNRWSEIAKGLDGRTENSVKNRYKCMIKKAKRRHPHSANLIELILTERKQKLADDIEPTDSESDLSEEVKISRLTKNDCIGSPIEGNYGMKPECMPFTPVLLYQPSDFLIGDCRDNFNMEGFTQYAEFAKHFDVNQRKAQRDSDFSPSPSMFIRSPH